MQLQTSTSAVTKIKPTKTIRLALNNKETDRKKEVSKTDTTNCCQMDDKVEDLIYPQLMTARFPIIKIGSQLNAACILCLLAPTQLNTFTYYHRRFPFQQNYRKQWNSSSKRVTHLFTCGLFSQVWLIFWSLTNYFKCHLFYQVWHISLNVTYL